MGGAATVGGNVQVPAASAYTYAAAKSYTIIYGPNDFQPADASAANAKYLTTYGNESAYVGAANGSLRIPLHLPQGAVVSSGTVLPGL